MDKEKNNQQIFKSFYKDSSLNQLHTKSKHQISASAEFILSKAESYVDSLKETSKSNIEQQQLSSLINQLESAYDINLSNKDRIKVLESLKHIIFDYGILKDLINNSEINDIIISRHDNISIQKSRQNIKTNLKFASSTQYEAFVESLLKKSNKSCTTSNPIADAAIEPHIRACVTHKSFSPPGMGPLLTLRISRQSEVSMNDLKKSSLAPPIILDYLSHIVSECADTILIAGEVGTGKTTLVKALITSINANEALLIIEDTHEINIEREFTRTLLTREANTEGAGEIKPDKAIKTGMRMAMNRIILGEMRDPAAAEAFIDTCSSGHPGMSTIHAKSASDAIARLELLLSRAERNTDIQTIRKQIANAISVVVFLEIDKKHNQRRISEIIEVHHSSDGAIQVSPILSLSYENDVPTWIMRNGISKFSKSLQKAGLALPKRHTNLYPSNKALLQLTTESLKVH